MSGERRLQGSTGDEWSDMASWPEAEAVLANYAPGAVLEVHLPSNNVVKLRLALEPEHRVQVVYSYSNARVQIACRCGWAWEEPDVHAAVMAWAEHAGLKK